MIPYPITAKILTVFTIMLSDPILREIIAEYKWDEKFLYIPKGRIKNKKILKMLLDTASENPLKKQ